MSHICTIATLSTQTLHLTARPDRFAGVGRPLGSLERATAALSAEKEAAIRERIQSMVRAGCGDKLELLLDELFAAPFFSEETLQQWYQEFASFEDDQGMTASLAVLIISILRPLLVASTNHEEQAFLLVSEARALEVIRVLMPDITDVKEFIRDCEKTLRDRELLCEREKIVRALCLTKIEAIKSKASEMDAQTQRAFYELKGRLQVLQQDRLTTHREQAVEVESLRRSIEQIHNQVRSFCKDRTILTLLDDTLNEIDHEDPIVELSDRVDESASRMAIENSLATQILACEQLLEREIVGHNLKPVHFLLLKLQGRKPDSVIKDDITTSGKEVESLLICILQERVEREKAARTMIRAFMDRAESIDLVGPRRGQIEALKNWVNSISETIKSMKDHLDEEAAEWKKIKEEASGHRQALQAMIGKNKTKSSLTLNLGT